jgi:excisionase family DNA binding protein
MERERDILTPDQVAEYLQVNRETVYRYIRNGKLPASRLGRSYRITRRNVDVLLRATTTTPDLPPRIYSDEEIDEFIQTDQLDDEAREIANRFAEAMQRRSARRATGVKSVDQSA